MAERCWWLIRHTPYRWVSRLQDRRRHGYPTPLWLKLWERRRPPWTLRHDHPGFCRHSPVMRRYRAWSEQRRAAIFAKADQVSVTPVPVPSRQAR
jgi:hypothetical protein